MVGFNWSVILLIIINKYLRQLAILAYSLGAMLQLPNFYTFFKKDRTYYESDDVKGFFLCPKYKPVKLF